jgi:hypothetical protein
MRCLALNELRGCRWSFKMPQPLDIRLDFLSDVGSGATRVL